MKKNIGIIIIVSTLFIIPLYLVVTYIGYKLLLREYAKPACDTCATIIEGAVSPSGKYVLLVKEVSENGSTLNYFLIMSATETEKDSENPSPENVVYTSTDKFRTRDTLYFLWDNNDRVWVYSGDVGTYFWEQGDNGLWTKHTYTDEDIEAPTFLKEVRPEYHKK